MRKALIVLGVVALVLVILGAVNHGLLFDIDLVVVTWTAVSLFWVGLVVAGVVVLAGMVVAYFSRTGAVATRRRLEKELQSTYERLRAAEAKLPRPAPVQAVVVEAVSGEQTAVTGAMATPGTDETAAVAVVPEDETAVVAAAPEDETAAVAPPATS